MVNVGLSSGLSFQHCVIIEYLHMNETKHINEINVIFNFDYNGLVNLEFFSRYYKHILVLITIAQIECHRHYVHAYTLVGGQTKKTPSNPFYISNYGTFFTYYTIM